MRQGQTPPCTSSSCWPAPTAGPRSSQPTTCLLYRLPCVKPTGTQQLFASSAITTTSRLRSSTQTKKSPGPALLLPLADVSRRRPEPASACHLTASKQAPTATSRRGEIESPDRQSPYPISPSTECNQAGCPPPKTSSPPSTTSTSSRQSPQHNRNPTIPGASASHRLSRRRRRARRAMRSRLESRRARTRHTPRA